MSSSRLPIHSTRLITHLLVPHTHRAQSRSQQERNTRFVATQKSCLLIQVHSPRFESGHANNNTSMRLSSLRIGWPSSISLPEIITIPFSISPLSLQLLIDSHACGRSHAVANDTHTHNTGGRDAGAQAGIAHAKDDDFDKVPTKEQGGG